MFQNPFGQSQHEFEIELYGRVVFCQKLLARTILKNVSKPFWSFSTFNLMSILVRLTF